MIGLFEFLTSEEMKMNIVCLDLEGVLVPEIWIAFADAVGIPELRRTTRDEPDYEKLMRWRLGILKEHGLGLAQIREAADKIVPFEGAREFLDSLREETQVIIVSDTYKEFAAPIMKKLGRPTLFCHELKVDGDGMISDFCLRPHSTKLETVKALQSIGFDTIASGDSYNDLGMIQASKAGFLFRTTDKIRADYPDIPAFTEYGELLDAIRAAL
jgi:phosphoserine/homoserine phosphotransferase